MFPDNWRSARGGKRLRDHGSAQIAPTRGKPRRRQVKSRLRIAFLSLLTVAKHLVQAAHRGSFGFSRKSQHVACVGLYLEVIRLVAGHSQEGMNIAQQMLAKFIGDVVPGVFRLDEKVCRVDACPRPSLRSARPHRQAAVGRLHADQARDADLHFVIDPVLVEESGAIARR